ncbi:MAG: hypothetical protein ABH884_04700, partial [Candidatus Komeilibacteria bacterium]
NQSGQGLLELVVAIGVVSVGLFSVWGLFIYNFNGEQEANARILAINLAREGVEVVKNMRDSNWLHIEDNQGCSYGGVLHSTCRFDSGLVDGGGNGDVGIIKELFSEDVYIDYVVTSLDDEATNLYVDGNGFYTHDNVGNTPTKYRRIIKMDNVCCDDDNEDLKCNDTSFNVQDSLCGAFELKVGIDVESSVRWTFQGKDRELSINHRIFNWK